MRAVQPVVDAIVEGELLALGDVLGRDEVDHQLLVVAEEHQVGQLGVVDEA